MLCVFAYAYVGDRPRFIMCTDTREIHKLRNYSDKIKFLPDTADKSPGSKQMSLALTGEELGRSADLAFFEVTQHQFVALTDLCCDCPMPHASRLCMAATCSAVAVYRWDWAPCTCRMPITGMCLPDHRIRTLSVKQSRSRASQVHLQCYEAQACDSNPLAGIPSRLLIKA